MQIYTNQHKTWSQYIYITIRSSISSIVGPIGQERPELFALKLEKSAEFDFVYTLESTNIIQLTTNLVNMYVTIRSSTNSNMIIGSQMSLMTGPIRLEQLE